MSEIRISGKSNQNEGKELFARFIEADLKNITFTPEEVEEFAPDVAQEMREKGMERIALHLLGAKYPWDKCIRDMKKRYGSEEIAKKVCGKIRAKSREGS